MNSPHLTHPLHPGLLVLKPCSKLGLQSYLMSKSRPRILYPQSVLAARWRCVRTSVRWKTRGPQWGRSGRRWLSRPFLREAPARHAQCAPVRAGACSGQVGIKTRHTTKEASLQRDTQSQGRLCFNLPPISDPQPTLSRVKGQPRPPAFPLINQIIASLTGNLLKWF